MFHRHALQRLIPITLRGVFDQVLVVDGKQFDTAADRAGQLLSEQFPDSAYEGLEEWERVYGSTPRFDDTLQIRQQRIVQKMRELGRLDRAYFVQMAAAFGYNVIVEELCPFMAGWGGAGDELGDDDSDWCWRVYYAEVDTFPFRAGESAAGETLNSPYSDVMKQIIEDLKPADTFVEFIEI